jgi:hypothetical protein
LHRDPAAARSAPTLPRNQPDDPLAGLARLIGQGVPMNDLAPAARRPTLSQSARELTSPARYSYAASDDVLQETRPEKYSTPKQSSYDPPDNSYDDARYEPSPPTDASLQSPSALYEHEPQSHPDAAQAHVESSGALYDEYEEQSHDHSDDHGEDCDEDPNPRRWGRFIFVAALFGLALLGTAGAFTYRAPFADSIVPSLLSIIKVERGPNKIIATSTASQGRVSPQADATDNAGSREHLVSREERPVDVPASVSTAAQSVPTAAIISDPAPAAGPDTASQFPLTPFAQSPAARVDGLNIPTTAPAPPIQSANHAAAPSAPSPTPASPGTPGPKKVRTVSIQTDQSNAADSAARQSLSVAVPTTGQGAKPSGANEPLSIVPSSNDVGTAAAGSARAAPPARSAPVGKPTATKIASTSPAASGGGYAVQVLSQHNEKEVQSSFRALQAKYPKLLGGREPIVRRADLGAKGVYYRAMVGPFVSAGQANEMCSNLKAAGGSCIVQKN